MIVWASLTPAVAASLLGVIGPNPKDYGFFLVSAIVSVVASRWQAKEYWPVVEPALLGVVGRQAGHPVR